MTLIALGRGLAAMLHLRCLLVFYLLGVVLALAVAIPFQQALDSDLAALPDPSRRAEALSEPWAGDLARQRAPVLGALASSAGVATWLHVLLSTILVGGALGAFDRRAAERRREEGQGYTYRIFLSDAGRWAWPMLRLLALSLPVFYLVDLAVNSGLHHVAQRIFSDREGDRLEVVAEWCVQGVFLALACLVSTWFDFARATVVMQRRRSVLLALSNAALSMVRGPIPVLAVAATFLVAELVVMASFTKVLSAVETTSWTSLLWWLVGSQLLVLLRVAIGLGRLGAYCALAEEE